MKNRFAQFVPAVMAILGIKDWNKDADKKTLYWQKRKKSLKTWALMKLFSLVFVKR